MLWEQTGSSHPNAGSIPQQGIDRQASWFGTAFEGQPSLDSSTDSDQVTVALCLL